MGRRPRLGFALFATGRRVLSANRPPLVPQDPGGVPELLVEHNGRAVLERCDVIHVLSRGRIVAVGAPDDDVDHPAVRSQYLR